jgi:hypothetical protein
MEAKVIRSYKGKGVKEIQAYIEPGTSHYKIKYEGGGEVPHELSGVYTSINVVDQTVLNFINSEKPTSKKKEVTEEPVSNKED